MSKTKLILYQQNLSFTWFSLMHDIFHLARELKKNEENQSNCHETNLHSQMDVFIFYTQNFLIQHPERDHLFFFSARAPGLAYLAWSFFSKRCPALNVCHWWPHLGALLTWAMAAEEGTESSLTSTMMASEEGS